MELHRLKPLCICQSAQLLTKTAAVLDIPVVVTEQYPKALGHTVAELDVSKAAKVVEKVEFSMVTSEVEQVRPPVLSSARRLRPTARCCSASSASAAAAAAAAAGATYRGGSSGAGCAAGRPDGRRAVRDRGPRLRAADLPRSHRQR